MIEIAQITDEQGLAELVPDWEELWQRDPTATPFQSPGWLLAWWRVFGSPDPVVLTARESGKLIGLLPLYLLREGGRRKLLPIGIGLSDYIGVLIDPATPGCVALLLRAVAELSAWDECWLPDIAPENALATASSCGLADRIEAAAPCPVLVLPRDRSPLGKIVPRKMLRDLHQARTRAESAGGIRFETIIGDQLEEAISDFFRLHEKRWRARGETGVCADLKIQSFHRAAARGLQARDLLRLYRLWIGSSVAAVYYGFVAKGRAYAYLGGFDPCLPRLSPGAQIIAYAIEQGIAEGATSFDFLRGAESYKYAWGAVDQNKISRYLIRQRHAD